MSVPTSIPITPPASAEPSPESYWGRPNDDSGHLDRLVATLPPDAPAVPPTPEPAPAPALDPAAEIASLRQEVQLMRSQPPSLAPLDPNSFASALAPALAQAFSTVATQRDAEAAQANALRRPTMALPDDPELLISDPTALQGTLTNGLNAGAEYAENLVRTAREQIMNEVRGPLQQATTIAAIARPLIQNEMMRAEATAQTRTGLDANAFAELLPVARHIIDSAQLPPEQRFQMRMDPATIAEAVHMANRNRSGGVPISHPSPAPPSAPLPTTATPAGPAMKTPSQRLVEHLLERPGMNWETLRRDRGHMIDRNNGPEVH